MALAIITKAMRGVSISSLQTTQIFKNYSIYTPDYLESMKPIIPLCPTIHVQIKGYVYPILENYQRLIHKIASNMDFDVEKSYAVPATKLKIDKYKPFSTNIEVEYKLDLYERNLVINDIPSTRLPIFIRVLEAAVPEGVILNIQEWDPKKENYRFVPDKGLLDLREELDDMQKKKK